MKMYRFFTSIRPRRITLPLAMLAILVATALPAQQLTTVGVVDTDRVYNSFYRDSQAVRELERLRQEYQQEINTELQQLESLRDRRLLAQEQGNDRLVENLNREIAQLERYLEDLTQRRRRQLEERQNSLLSDDFFVDMQSAIQFVAESLGYTVVLRADSDGLQWWSSEVDISEQVVQRLIQVADR
jgi:outer membrane protein